MFLLLNDPNLAGFDIALITFGIGYTIYIYYRPFGPGWTWLSVVIGVGFTIVIDAWVRAVFRARVGCNIPPGIPFTTWAAFAETGLPMIGGQVIKYLNQKRENGRLESRFRKGINGNK